jgi:hypothetical protein
MIRSTARALLHGVELRHLPVAVRLSDLPVVRTFLCMGERDVDITGLDVPAALKPLVIGIRETATWPHAAAACWRLENRSLEGALLGSMELESFGHIELGRDTISLFRPRHARTACVTALERHWRYLLAWRKAWVRRRTPGLNMTSADLIALDVYYQKPRPVWLVTVPHAAQFNMFPMDLLQFFEDKRLFLALRSTSPSIPFMRQRCAIALSAVPADLKPVIYSLGSHHQAAYDPSKPLPFATVRSASHGLPVAAPAFRVTEWTITDWKEVGSHTCFIADYAGDTELGSAAQLAHVSALFAHSEFAARVPIAAIA